MASIIYPAPSLALMANIIPEDRSWGYMVVMRNPKMLPEKKRAIGAT
jgi:hypothetical protein